MAREVVVPWKLRRAVERYIWLCRVVYSGVYGYARLCGTMYGYRALHMAMYGNVAVCMAMQGYVAVGMFMQGFEFY